jgi:Zn-finger nucleic acid-binding protein
MGIQEIIKIIRTRCPKSRYTFLDGDDLEDYLTDTNAIIKEYKNNFESISMTYMADEKYESNNIFYAVIKVKFRHFVNEEFFKVIAID